MSRRRKLLIITIALTTLLTASTPDPGIPIDSYQRYVANQLSWRTSRNPDVWQTTCGPEDRVEQPGMVAFRNLTLARMGGSNGAIWACSRFEHEEGRAWDWMEYTDNPDDVARVTAMLDWLLAPDAYGRPHAMARRLGLYQIIWDHQIIELYDTHPTWGIYYCSDAQGTCHTNHVHFVMSWAGAREETSWFTTDPRPASWYPNPP